MAGHGRDLEGSSRAGNAIIIFGLLSEQIHGAYESDEGWIPCRWNLDGTFIDVSNPRGLDLLIEG